MKKKAVDPLDIIIAILGLIFALTVASWFVGLGVYVTTAVAGLFAYAYTQAPRRTWPTAEHIARGHDLTTKVALVTGATSGIGVETARVLALQGAHVYLAARNPQKLQDTKDLLMESLANAKISTLVCDLADLASVQACAQTFLKQETKLHLLINNAGIMALPERTPTKQQLESQVGVCHVGHFYLTQLLLPALVKAATKEAPARVVALSSVAHRNHNLSVLLESNTLETAPYHPDTAYGNAKTCNLLFAHELHQRYYASKHVAAFSVMPGGIFTGLQGHVAPWKMLKWTVVAPFFFKSIPQGAATSMVCALTANPDTEGGEYFDNCKAVKTVVETVKSESSADAATRLWTMTEALLKDLGF